MRASRPRSHHSSSSTAPAVKRPRRTQPSASSCTQRRLDRGSGEAEPRRQRRGRRRPDAVHPAAHDGADRVETLGDGSVASAARAARCARAANAIRGRSADDEGIRQRQRQKAKSPPPPVAVWLGLVTAVVLGSSAPPTATTRSAPTSSSSHSRPRLRIRRRQQCRASAAHRAPRRRRARPATPGGAPRRSPRRRARRRRRRGRDRCGAASTARARRSSSGASSRKAYGLALRISCDIGDGAAVSTASVRIAPDSMRSSTARRPSASIASCRQLSSVSFTSGWSGGSIGPGVVVAAGELGRETPRRAGPRRACAGAASARGGRR